MDEPTIAGATSRSRELPATPDALSHGTISETLNHRDAIHCDSAMHPFPETPVGQTWGNVALLAATTLNADTPHSEATPLSAQCHQPDGRVHSDARDDDRRHGIRPARSG